MENGSWEAQDLEGKTHGRLGRPRPQDQSNFLEWSISDAIMNQGFPSLRMVVINDYHFWIWRATDYKKPIELSKRCRALPMDDAVGNEVHATKIGEVLTQWDWEFVMDGSTVLPQDARDEFKRAANRFVFVKREDDT